MTDLTEQEKEKIRNALDSISNELESERKQLRFWSKIVALIFTIGLILMSVGLLW